MNFSNFIDAILKGNKVITELMNKKQLSLVLRASSSIKRKLFF